MLGLRGFLLPAAFLVQTQPAPWPVLFAEAASGVQIQCRSIPAPEGWQIQLKNAGSGPIHFGLSLGPLPAGVEIPERIHLIPGAKATLELPSSPARIQLLRLRTGEDEGAFLIS